MCRIAYFALSKREIQKAWDLFAFVSRSSAKRVFRCTRGVAALLLEAARPRTGCELPVTGGFLVF